MIAPYAQVSDKKLASHASKLLYCDHPVTRTWVSNWFENFSAEGECMMAFSAGVAILQEASAASIEFSTLDKTSVRHRRYIEAKI